MIVGNFKSLADEGAKREMQRKLLEVSVANEETLAKRNQEHQRPDYEAYKVKPQYKTNAEIAKDRLVQEKEAFTNLEKLGLDYQQSAELIAWLSSSVVNRLIDFNANFKGIEKEIKETVNPKLLSVQYLENYLEEYFNDMDVNFGRKMRSKAGEEVPLASTIEKLMEMFPSIASLEQLENILRDTMLAIWKDIASDPEYLDDKTRQKYEQIQEKCSIAIAMIKIYKSSIPDEQFINDMKTTLTQNERQRLIKSYSSLLRRHNLLSQSEVDEFIQQSSDVIESGVDSLMKWVNKIIKSLSVITDEKQVTSLNKIEEDYIKMANRGENKIVDNHITIKRKEEQEKARESLKDAIRNARLDIKSAEREAMIDEYRRMNPNVQDPRGAEDERMIEINNDLIRNEEYGKEAATNAYRRRMIDNTDEFLKEVLTSGGKSKSKVYDKILIENFGVDPDEIDGLTDAAKKAKIRYLQTEKIVANERLDEPYDSPNRFGYDPIKRPTYRYVTKKHREGMLAGLPEEYTRLGLGLTEEVVKHFKKDNKEMKTLSKALKEHEKVEHDAGLGFKAKRVQIKKKVGKGVQIDEEESPTYRQFGKYVIHIPHLLNNNTANFKYPSHGSIPTLKPLTISDDYKEFLVDILNTGKMDDKVLKHLPPAEIKHFEKVCMGANLVEKFNLKLRSSDDEKKDLERFEVLKGEFFAGNNNEKMIKELRQLVIKFINEGRVHKNEGLSLLMELSAI